MYSTASSPNQEQVEQKRVSRRSRQQYPIAPRQYSRIHRFFRDNWEGWMFVLPLVIGLGVFTVYPMVQSLFWSFLNYTGNQYYYPVGINNYISILTKDAHFWKVFGNTCYYAFVSVPIVLISGYLLACLANQPYKGIGVFRVVFYLPCVIPGIVSGILWKDMFSTNGVFNQIFALFGGHSEFFMSENSFISISSIFLMNLWSIGGGMILWLSAFKAIPTQLYEAAKIDGGGRIARFWYITIPMSAPMLFFNVVTMLIGTFQYNGSLVLYPPTGAGYRDSMNMFAVYIYNQAFISAKWGYSSALSWLLLIFIGIVTGALFFVRHLIEKED